MNKHAKTLRAVIALLPPNVRTSYGAQISAAAEEIDQLDASLTNYKMFVQTLSRCAGGMVNGNRLSAQAIELLEKR